MDYEKPVLLSMNNLSSQVGYAADCLTGSNASDACTSGATASGDNCATGTSAGIDCDNGTTAVARDCKTGGTPGDKCSPGGSP